ncbi:DUF5391 family protein [Lysinibacillus sp. NPDC093688]|uniref:DUF5391 family protein n=1 Tax=Lysinibacillus sp. NPDC093688 TaxID=3390577 RepID=UPI003D054F04
MRNGVILMTIISGLLFCFIMIAVSLTPLPDPGGFNSLGMWLNIIMFLVFYILSLILYWVGVKGMKYVMAVFCGVGLLISLSIIVLAFVMGTVTYNVSDFLYVIVLCVMSLIANIVWYIVAFKK